MANIDKDTVKGFGEEWSAFQQDRLDEKEALEQFNRYFSVFDWQKINSQSVGFDLGCGSGRWAKLMASKVGTLYCVDASDKALAVAKKNLNALPNCQFINTTVDNMPFSDSSMDFGYSLGVLHHIPDTYAAIESCVKKIKSGAPFLAYIYYAFDNKPLWFRSIWKVSDLLRLFICKLPFPIKKALCILIATAVYWPLARLSGFLEEMGSNVDNIPLSAYRFLSFYSMQTDALDRFGTRLEQRFSKRQIKEMFERAGLQNVKFSDSIPYWCATGTKK